jgi:hypothetical protein
VLTVRGLDQPFIVMQGNALGRRAASVGVGEAVTVTWSEEDALILPA